MDRTFVQGVAESPVDSAIVRAVIDLANAMGIAAVAEGVETEDQVAGLKMLGCQMGQGFYFSRPLRAEEFDGAAHPALRADRPLGGAAGAPSTGVIDEVAWPRRREVVAACTRRPLVFLWHADIVSQFETVSPRETD